MPYLPDFPTFCELARGHDLVPVYRQLVSDTLTPVSAYGRLPPGDDTFLFESVVGGERIGRYSFLGAQPFLWLEAHGSRVTRRQGAEVTAWDCDDPLAELERLIAAHRAPHIPGLPRFAGGAVGYAGYDTVRYVERLPNAPTDDRHLPDMAFAFYDRMVIFDQLRKTVLVVAHANVRDADLRAAYDNACQRADELCDRLSQPTDGLQLTDINLAGPPTLAYQSNMTREQYEGAVEKSKDYIRAGDIFQVVVSQRLSVATNARPLDIYRALRVVNPSPFMFLLTMRGVSLIGSSPEIMVRVEDGEVTIRPLAGTRRRGLTDAEDVALEQELLADEKERAEHVMLVDLARNDVGRVAEYGSVELSDVMKVERYSHVMHITSNVTGQLVPGKSALDALRSGLPAGTVSGAPKVRAMQIIDELEPHRRGPYGGAVGYLDYTGNMDTCIALRTIVLQGNTAYVQAGAGLVADSVPATEYEETLSKARGLLKALEVAEQQLTKR
ncbi:MAG TPA: anthranilate synthase component I [Planctomycetaceae bacterium]|nr:anthranilate synthase component I [Planctomycetaceae bacterium]